MPTLDRSCTERGVIARRFCILSYMVAMVCGAAPGLHAQIDSMSLTRVVNTALPVADAQTILSIVADVESRGLPTSLLRAKVREGISKKAPGPRIVSIVRAYAEALGDARDALGATANGTELEAAAIALRAGIRAGVLRQMRTARPSESISSPLVIAVDLVTRGVPVDSVSAGIVSLLGSGATDAEFQQLQMQVARSMLSGASPLPAYRSFLAAPRATGGASAAKRPPLEEPSSVRVP